MRIFEVKNDTIAKLAGLQVDDIILSVNNQLVNDAQLVVKLIGQKSEITLLILRGNNQMFVTLSIN